jgi:hypothetical protein
MVISAVNAITMTPARAAWIFGPLGDVSKDWKRHHSGFLPRI